MKKFKFGMMGNLMHIAFPNKLVKSRQDLLIILLESCRFMIQNPVVDHADNLLMLVVNDMNRLFFCTEKKMFSISFPFNVECYPAIHINYQGIDIDSSMISNLCSFLSSSEFGANSSYDFVTPILEQEDNNSSNDFWIVLKHLLTYEIGYVRYDDDIEGFKVACNAGIPKCHPRYHYDVNLSQQAAFKIGLDKKLTPDKFVEFLDDTKERKVLKI